MTQNQQNIVIPGEYTSTIEDILKWLELGKNKDKSYNINLEHLRLFLDGLKGERELILKTSTWKSYFLESTTDD